MTINPIHTKADLRFGRDLDRSTSSPNIHGKCVRPPHGWGMLMSYQLRQSHAHDDMRVETANDEQYEPRAVGGYRILRCLGRGGMSSVYLGYAPDTLTAAAVKVPARHLSIRSAALSRFHRESRISRSLSHPCLVRGLQSGFDHISDSHYLSMEYVEGWSVKAAIDLHGPLPIGTAVAIAVDVCRALEYLNSLDYVHRDVKPENILIDRVGRAKLADLGLAKRLSGDDGLTADNQRVGTLAYMPPEQIANAGLADGRSDLFALAATMFHMVTGRVPYTGTSHEEMMAERHPSTRPTILKDRPTAPLALDALIATGLAPLPADRIESAADFADRLVGLGLKPQSPDVWSLLSDIKFQPNGDCSDSPTRLWQAAGGSNQPVIPQEAR